MSTITKEFTKEQLIEELERRIDVTTHYPDLEVAQLDAAILKIALASLEAEPASEFYHEKQGGWYEISEDDKVPDNRRVPLYTAPPAPVVPAELHPDTQKLVIDFCTALAEKLYKAQLKYGYDADWKQDGWPTQCQAHFHQHIAKGDPRDVAAYCAFMWYHGWKTESEPAPVYVHDERAAFNAWNNDTDCPLAGRDAKTAAWLAWSRRAAMLQGAEPVTTANKLPFEQWLSQQTGTIDVECGCVMTEVFFHWLRVAYEDSNSPVIPDGWVMLPAEPTQAMMNAWLSEVANWRGHEAGYKAMIAAAPQLEVK